MDIIKFLQNKTSTPALNLVQPGPSSEQLHQILQTATSVPDHGQLHPWRLLIIENKTKLAEIFIQAMQTRDPQTDIKRLEKQHKITKAPVIITVIAKTNPDIAKVPVQEQIICAALVAQHILLAAESLGFAGVWYTGANAYDSLVKQALGLIENEVIVGFLYIGSVEEKKNKERVDIKDYITYFK